MSSFRPLAALKHKLSMLSEKKPIVMSTDYPTKKIQLLHAGNCLTAVNNLQWNIIFITWDEQCEDEKVWGFKEEFIKLFKLLLHSKSKKLIFDCENMNEEIQLDIFKSGASSFLDALSAGVKIACVTSVNKLNIVEFHSKNIDIFPNLEEAKKWINN